MVLIGFLKVGNIATAPMIELLLDERAEREDMEVRVVSSGGNMVGRQSEEVAKIMVGLKPDLVFLTSPNASTKGPTKAREIISAAGIPVVVVSDGPKALIEELQDAVGRQRRGRVSAESTVDSGCLATDGLLPAVRTAR